MELWQLRQRQSLPLEAKIIHAEQVIRQWHEYYDGNVYISFSGGKDSTVLLHLVRQLYPEVPAVFCDTGLEFPEIRDFVKLIANTFTYTVQKFDTIKKIAKKFNKTVNEIYEHPFNSKIKLNNGCVHINQKVYILIEGAGNVIFIKPKMPFTRVIEKYGYPILSKETADRIYRVRISPPDGYAIKKYIHGLNQDDTPTQFKLSKLGIKMIDAPFKISAECCNCMKKAPFKKYEKETGRKRYVGTMTSDSKLREMRYLKDGGCNTFDNKRPGSSPLSPWLEKDIWEYISLFDVPYCSVYDMGYDRTGCMFCMFGIHMEESPNRFQIMANTHSKQYEYCINKLGCGPVLDFIGIDYKPQTEYIQFPYNSRWDILVKLWNKNEEIEGDPK